MSQGANENLAKLRALTQRLNESEDRWRRLLKVRDRVLGVLRTVAGDDVYGAVLEVIREAFHSPYGALGYLDADDNWICPSITKSVWEKCDIPGKTTIFGKAIWDTATWGAVYKTRKVFWLNENIAVPEGHIPIDRIMIAPITHNHTLIGMMAIANMDTDYTAEDAKSLEMIASLVAPLFFEKLAVNGIR